MIAENIAIKLLFKNTFKGKTIIYKIRKIA